MPAVRTFVVTLLALLFGAQQALCACPSELSVSPITVPYSSADAQPHVDDLCAEHSKGGTDENGQPCGHCDTSLKLLKADDSRAALVPAPLKVAILDAFPVSHSSVALVGNTYFSPLSTRGPPLRQTPVSLKTRLLN